MAAAVERTYVPHVMQVRRCRPMAVFVMGAARIQFIKSTSVAAG